MTLAPPAARLPRIDAVPMALRRHCWPLAGLAVTAALALAGCTSADGDAAAPAPAATEPRAVDTPPPDYPLELACAGAGGQVVLVLSLDAQGLPAEVRVENSSRRPALDASAVAAVRSWRFKPATRRGQPVPTRIRVPVTFTPPVMRPDRCFAFDEEQRRAR